MNAKTEIDGIAALYIERGEDWENDPQAYVAAFRGKRAEFMEAFANLDYLAMVRLWDDATLYDVMASGSDLAFTKGQRRAMGNAAMTEYTRRNPPRLRKNHGMND